jgi:predicted short-subunit dehydrogenase-like oxidoreductase (DUF2520 family)
MIRARLRHSRTAGLISSGGVAQLFLARLPSLLSTIGPVKAASLRVARRISNTLRAGHAVEHYSDLERCQLIWIAVPDATVDRVSRDLGASLSIPGRMFVLCGSNLDSLRAVRLQAAGSRVATLNAMDRDARTLIAEGHPHVLRELKHLLAADKRKLIELRSSAKSLYLAGVQLAERLALPWISAALESFRAAGFTRAEAAEAVALMNSRAVRAYGKAGKKAWTPTVVAGLRGALEHDLESIRKQDPRLAALYAAGVMLATRYFETP